MNSQHTLNYTIYASFSDGPSFDPKNIITDDPNNANSRWSAGKNRASWIMLELDKPAVVRRKHCVRQVHPCNMKDFKVFAGAESDHLTEVLRASLKDDTVPEEFVLRNNSGSYIKPIRYVRIDPISAYGLSFNASIWHVKLLGCDDEEYVHKAMGQYHQHQDEHITLLVLKYLRKKGWSSAYSSLLQESGVELEHPLISQLYERIVLNGYWDGAIILISTLAQRMFIRKPPARVYWKRTLVHLESDALPPLGQSLCLDTKENAIYTFGSRGHSIGNQLWCYSISEATWKVLPGFGEGCSPDLCSKIVMDNIEGCIYFIGRMPRGRMNGKSTTQYGHESSSSNVPTSDEENSPFFKYFVRGPKTGTLTCIDHDTRIVGGPPALWDHQVAIDEKLRRIYVYGGRTNSLTGPILNAECFVYDIVTHQWAAPWRDNRNMNARSLPARYGHGLVAMSCDLASCMISLGGIGNGDVDLQSEMILYQPNEDAFRIRYDAPLSKPVSACVDAESGDIFSLHGLPCSEVRNVSSTHLPPALSIFDMQTSAWINTDCFDETDKVATSILPAADWTHPSLYNPEQQTVYTFAEHGSALGRKLSILWQGRLERTPLDWLIRKLTLFIRTQQFREKCEEDSASVASLMFLKLIVSPLVDCNERDEEELIQSLVWQLLSSNFTPLSSRGHSENGQADSVIGSLSDGLAEESHVFSGLPASPFQADTTGGSSVSKPQRNLNRLTQRLAVFKQIIQYIKTGVREPDEDLVELLSRLGDAS